MYTPTNPVTIDHEEIVRAIIRGRRLRSQMAWHIIDQGRTALSRLLCKLGALVGFGTYPSVRQSPSNG